GVRGAHLALALFAVQSDGIGGKLFAPKSRFEADAEIFGGAAQLDRARVLAQGAGNSGGAHFRGVAISLHFAQRDGAFCQGAVSMKDRILRVLPPLLHKTLGRTAVIFDESIPIRIAMTIDPIQSQLDVRPYGADEVQVGGTSS